MSERKHIYLCLAHMSEAGWELKGIRGTGTSIHAFMCLKNVCK